MTSVFESKPTGPQGGAAGRRAGAGAPLGRLRALVLLAGSVRTTGFHAAIGRALLDLPLEPGRTLLRHWHDFAREAAEFIGLGRLPLRVLMDRKAAPPELAGCDERVSLQVERDPLELRGTGGVLRDLSVGYGEDDFILVATAAQLMLDPPETLLEALGQARADVALLAEPDGTPAGLTLIRCAALQSVAPVGFVDFKEQALPAIAARQPVGVVRRPVVRYPIRSHGDYVRALQELYRRRRGAPNDPFAEDWRPVFEMAEDGALVKPGASLHDSVVLEGGVVESGAVVVRSLVCAGGRVARNRTVVDQLVAPGNGRLRQES